MTNDLLEERGRSQTAKSERPIPAPPGFESAIPGGWVERVWDIGSRELRLALPADPDAFLDDPAVLARHDQDGYMPYWAYLWPSALKFARLVLQADWPTETRILELGAGVAFVGLCAALRGYNVTITDYEPLVPRLAQYNATLNGIPTPAADVLDWRHPPAITVDRLLGCELLYENRHHEPLLQLTQQMLAPGGVAWFADGGRAHAERFWNLLPQFGLTGRILDETGTPLSQPRVGRYQLFEVQRKA